jgi:CRP-like cAMP-binding protein
VWVSRKGESARTEYLLGLMLSDDMLVQHSVKLDEQRKSSVRTSSPSSRLSLLSLNWNEAAKEGERTSLELALMLTKFRGPSSSNGGSGSSSGGSRRAAAELAGRR